VILPGSFQIRVVCPFLPGNLLFTSFCFKHSCLVNAFLSVMQRAHSRNPAKSSSHLLKSRPSVCSRHDLGFSLSCSPLAFDVRHFWFGSCPFEGWSRVFSPKGTVRRLETHFFLQKTLPPGVKVSGYFDGFASSNSASELIRHRSSGFLHP